MAHASRQRGKNKTGLLLFAGALFAVFMTAEATAGFSQSADTSQLMGRINQLENQIQTLSRTVYRGKTPSASEAAAFSGGGADSSAVANLEVRLSQLESQQRTLTGQLERMNHDVQQMKTRLDRALADNDMRFQQLERGGVKTGAASATDNTLYAQDVTAQVTGARTSGNSPAGTLGSVSNASTTSRASDPASILYDTAFSDIREAKYEAAEDKFKRFMAMYPSHALAANAQYWLAETYYVRGNYAQAARSFAQGYQDYPKGAKAPDSLLKLALSLSQIGKKEDACLSFAQLKKEYGSEQTPVVRRAEQEAKRIGCK
ncbi:MAG TPA: tol-pal system protein YbgF [Alphaproteobacteria bacterium]|nr:tol-pal system protein YbgF [Alphaproteobacteria bacterium]